MYVHFFEKKTNFIPSSEQKIIASREKKIIFINEVPFLKENKIVKLFEVSFNESFSSKRVK